MATLSIGDPRGERMLGWVRPAPTQATLLAASALSYQHGRAVRHEGLVTPFRSAIQRTTDPRHSIQPLTSHHISTKLPAGILKSGRTGRCGSR